MVTSSESVEIDRSPDGVYRFVADLRNEPTWHEDIESVPPDTPPAPSVGRTVTVRFKPFMGKTEGTFTALEVEPPRRIVYRASLGGLQPVITYLVEPTAAGTRFTREVDLRPRGFAKVMTPMMAIMMPRRNRVFVENLKRTLEGSAEA
jgi:uncharacterized protein YndB with AHSA1/START domain